MENENNEEQDQEHLDELELQKESSESLMLY